MEDEVKQLRRQVEAWKVAAEACYAVLENVHSEAVGVARRAIKSARYVDEDPRCDICNSSNDLRIAPIMTGDKFGQTPKHPVCRECLHAWYDGGGTCPESIIRIRFPDEFKD